MTRDDLQAGSELMSYISKVLLGGELDGQVLARAERATLMVVDYLFNEQYRFWMTSFGIMKADYWFIVLKYALVLFPIYFVIGAAVNYTKRTDIPEWRDTLITVVVNSLGVWLCCLVNYLIMRTSYDGTLFIVSHDRYLINKLADRIYDLRQDGVREYIGNYEEYLAARKAEQEQVQQAAAAVQAPKVNEYQLRKEKAAELRKTKAALARLEKENEENDETIRQISESLQDPETASDYEKALELSAELERLNARNEAILEEWEALSEKLEQLE